MDNVYYEQLVKDTRRKRCIALRILMIIGALLILGAALLFWSQFGRYCYMLLLTFIIIFFLIFWRRLSREYEYIFTDGQIDIDVIFSQKTRKHLMSVDAKNILLLATATEPRYQEYFNRDFDQKVRADDGRTAEEALADGVVYYILLAQEGEKTYKLSWCPNETMVDLIKKKNPRVVIAAGRPARPVDL